MDKVRSIEKLAIICRSIGFFLMALATTKLVSLFLLDKSALELMNWISIAKMSDQSQFCGNLAMSFFFIFLSEILKSLYDEAVAITPLSQRLCRTVIFLLTAQAVISIVSGISSYSHTLAMIHGDTSFLLKLIVPLAIDLVNRATPLVLALVLYKLFNEFERLSTFEKEVI
jgi:hypothetical protein